APWLASRPTESGGGWARAVGPGGGSPLVAEPQPPSQGQRAVVHSHGTRGRGDVPWKTPGPQRASGPSCCARAHAPAHPAPPGRKAPRMSLHGLLDAVVKDTALAEAITAATDGNRMHVDLVGPPAARPFTIAALARDTGRPVLAVTATGREAEDLASALRSLLPPEGVVEYPSSDMRPHARGRPRHATVCA